MAPVVVVVAVVGANGRPAAAPHVFVVAAATVEQGEGLRAALGRLRTPAAARRRPATVAPDLRSLPVCAPPLLSLATPQMLTVTGRHEKATRLEVTLDSSTSVAALAEAFAAKLGAPPAGVAMTVGGAVLDDPTTSLDAAGIVSGATVALRVKRGSKANKGEGSRRLLGVVHAARSRRPLFA